VATVDLGADSAYPERYDPSLLRKIPRTQNRGRLANIRAFSGWDLWTAWELSWLNAQGIPEVAVAEFKIDCNSVNIVESKSFKYYLNSLNQCEFAAREDLVRTLTRDLTELVEGEIGIQLRDVDGGAESAAIPGRCLDNISLPRPAFVLDTSLLRGTDRPVQNERVYTNLFKSNCPVTAQPDWASVWIEYSGTAIEETGLLSYLLGYRKHQGFHEDCVEKIYCDILESVPVSALTVFARYTRRGGLDINPLRSSENIYIESIPFGRTLRQ